MEKLLKIAVPTCVATLSHLDNCLQRKFGATVGSGAADDVRFRLGIFVFCDVYDNLGSVG